MERSHLVFAPSIGRTASQNADPATPPHEMAAAVSCAQYTYDEEEEVAVVPASVRSRLGS
jgi:hypothetical protein